MFYACGCLGSEAIQEKSSRIQVTSQCNASLHDWAATHELKFILMRRAKTEYVCMFQTYIHAWSLRHTYIHTYMHTYIHTYILTFARRINIGFNSCATHRIDILKRTRRGQCFQKQNENIFGHWAAWVQFQGSSAKSAVAKLVEFGHMISSTTSWFVELWR